MKDNFVGKSILSNNENPSAKAIFDAAKNGDQLALEVVEYVSYYLGYACHIISITTNPPVIVIGGGVSKAGDFLIDKVNKYFQEFAISDVVGTKIVKAELGNDAGIYGGAKLVTNHG